MFRRLDPFGNPNVGVYVRATATQAFAPPGLTQQNLQDLEAALGFAPHILTIGGSPLVGSLLAANSRGAVAADFATDEELQVLRDAGLEVMRLAHTRLNAAGNNLLVNDHGAMAHPDLPDATLEAIAEVLGVPVERGVLGGVPTVGTAGVATDKGVLAHPLSTDEELAHARRCLQAPARIGTVNHGHGLVGAGMAANTKGAACGSRTTGIELGRIEEALGYLE